MITKGYGVSAGDIKWSCPKDLEPYIEAYKLEEKKKDENNWMLGLYIQSAVSVAVEHNLAGKKAKSKYLEKPLLQEAEDKNREITPEEMDREIQKAILMERQWISRLKAKGMEQSKV